VRAGRDNADLAQLGINDLPLHYVKLKQSVSRQADARLFAIYVLPILRSTFRCAVFPVCWTRRTW